MSMAKKQKVRSSMSNINSKDSIFKRLTPITLINKNELRSKIVYIKSIHPAIKRTDINLSQIQNRTNINQSIETTNKSCIKPMISKLNKCVNINTKKTCEMSRNISDSNEVCFKEYCQTTKNLIVKLNDPILEKVNVKAVPLNSPRETPKTVITAACEFQTKLTESNVGIKYHFKKEVLKKLVNPFSNKLGSVRLKDLIPARLGLKSSSSAQSNPSPFQSTTSNTYNFHKASPDFIPATATVSETEFIKNAAQQSKSKFSPILKNNSIPMSSINYKIKNDLLMSKYSRPQAKESTKITTSNFSISEKMFNNYFEHKISIESKINVQTKCKVHNELFNSKISEESILNLSGKKCKLYRKCA